MFYLFCGHSFRARRRARKERPPRTSTCAKRSDHGSSSWSSFYFSSVSALYILVFLLLFLCFSGSLPSRTSTCAKGTTAANVDVRKKERPLFFFLVLFLFLFCLGFVYLSLLVALPLFCWFSPFAHVDVRERSERRACRRAQKGATTVLLPGPLSISLPSRLCIS